jgi:hypothetical protein
MGRAILSPDRPGWSRAQFCLAAGFLVTCHRYIGGCCATKPRVWGFVAEMLMSEDWPVQRISGNGFGRGQTILIEGKDQTKNHREPLLAALSASRITSQTRRARDSLILSRSLSQKP